MKKKRGRIDEYPYLGIDPGLTGGFVVVSGSKIIYKMAMPTLSFTLQKGKTKKEIDREGVLSFLQKLPERVHVVIEEQKAYRGQNIDSSCTTCKNYGILLMALTMAYGYVTEVSSSLWQSHFGIVSIKESGGASTKVQALFYAQSLYPDADFRKSNQAQVAHEGIVDACLIANYCQSLFSSSGESMAERKRRIERGYTGGSLAITSIKRFAKPTSTKRKGGKV